MQYGATDAAISSPASLFGPRAVWTLARVHRETAQQYRMACQMNAATTGTATAAGNPNSRARMNPAVASMAQTTDVAITNSRNERPVERLAGACKLSIVAVALGCGFVGSSAGQMPPDLVRRVAESGSRLAEERSHYTYTQRFRFIEFARGRPVGRYEELRDVTFTGDGERAERHQRRPVLQLKRLRLTEEDFRDLRDVNPFVLTSENLRFYKVSYKGTQSIDGHECHVLQARPRQILQGQRFFDGFLWVGKDSGEVVQAGGRPVPQIHGIESSNLFPHFVTQYAPVDGKHWFPVRTEGDDVLPFPSGNQRVQILIEYTDYKRFTATSTIDFDERNVQQVQP